MTANLNKIQEKKYADVELKKHLLLLSMLNRILRKQKQSYFLELFQSICIDTFIQKMRHLQNKAKGRHWYNSIVITTSE